MKAPTFAMPAESPGPVAEYEGGGVGAELREEVADPVDHEERHEQGCDAGHHAEREEGESHHEEADPLQAAMADVVELQDGQEVSWDGGYDESHRIVHLSLRCC